MAADDLASPTLAASIASVIMHLSRRIPCRGTPGLGADAVRIAFAPGVHEKTQAT
jgi:hypothetical protein